MGLVGQRVHHVALGGLAALNVAVSNRRMVVVGKSDGEGMACSWGRPTLVVVDGVN